MVSNSKSSVEEFLKNSITGELKILKILVIWAEIF